MIRDNVQDIDATKEQLEAKKQGYKSMRIDTHEKNIPMRNLIEKNGFVYCGKTMLRSFKDRLVFEKII